MDSSASRCQREEDPPLRGLFTGEVEHRCEVHYLPAHVVRKGQHPNILECNLLNSLPALLSYINGVRENLALAQVLQAHAAVLDDNQPHYYNKAKAFF